MTDVRVQRIVKDLAHKMRPVTVATTPTLAEVTREMRKHFRGAHLFAPAFFRTMQRQKWRDRNGRDVTHWPAMAKAYASKAALRKL